MIAEKEIGKQMIDPGELFLYGYYREMKKRNLVAKNSKHKSGAGAHKSDKDYDRKVGKQELIDLLRQQQENLNGISEWTRLEEEIQSLLDSEEEDGERSDQ